MTVRHAPPPLAAAILALSLCQPAFAARSEPAPPAGGASNLDGTQVALAQVSQPLLEAEAVQHAPKHDAAADEPALAEPGALAVAGAGLLVLLLAGRRRAGNEAFADRR
jgi:hypothetical protein